MIHAKAYSHLRKLPDPPFVGKLFHNRLSLHKILGSAILASGVVHIIAHSVRRSVAWFSQESVSSVPGKILFKEKFNF